MAHTDTSLRPAFEVRFASLYVEGRGFSFPCDSEGRMDLDAAPERMRNNYLFARAMVGREFAWPAVRAMSAN